ncbi:MAG TPA: Omp28-related outer membrane protein [Chitinophagaceae bacterium]|nr:Omp28-related outer membrane protein [Chitinophagaceae bacterium]
MKNIGRWSFFVVNVLLFYACTKVESDFTTDEKPIDIPQQERITLNASSYTVTAGSTVSFTVLSSLNNTNVTGQSKVYVNNSLISGNSFTFTTEGTFTVYSKKDTLTSNTVNINVTSTPPPPSETRYQHRVLVEEYSGTWCGNCPRLLYGVDLLHQQTAKAIVTSIHLFNNDPFITSDGNSLAANQGVYGVPSAKINRLTDWTGPQYENVPQVLAAIQSSSTTGLAISSTVSGSNLNIKVKFAYSIPLSGSSAKLTVYLVEDNLYYTQRNYSSNLYGGLAYIPNFRYDGVLRKIVSPLGGDDIPTSGNLNEKNYTITLPSNISNVNYAKIVAFVTNSAGKVVNVLDAYIGVEKGFEVL